MLSYEELRREAELFFEWPSSEKHVVTLTSAIFFTQKMIEKALAEADHNAIQECNQLSLLCKNSPV